MTALLVVVAAEAQRQRVARIEAERHSTGPVVLIVRSVLHIRVMRHALPGDANGRAVAKRHVVPAHELPAVVAAVFGGQFTVLHAKLRMPR